MVSVGCVSGGRTTAYTYFESLQYKHKACFETRKYEARQCVAHSWSGSASNGHELVLTPGNLQSKAKYMMRISEIAPSSTPEKQRLAQLKLSSDRARDALSQERQRQKIKKAQAALRAASQPSAPTIEPVRPA